MSDAETKTVDIRERSLAHARELVSSALAGTNAVIWLFGSYARGNAGPHSDIDIAIESEAPLPTGLLARLRLALEESTIPYRVEIVDLHDADREFREAVYEEGIRWSA
ncbi:MAG: nucleotidyltransferase domain-containing protein [Alphaproteobacteria bacterium]|jgi:hypothetical protein|nr:nucleotidyltransferase domain-containing protein [Alphaproteobacteria bacterium]